MKSRRVFLTEVGAASLAGSLISSLGCAERRQDPTGSGGRPELPRRSRVVMVRCPSLRETGPGVDRATIRRMLEAGLCRLWDVRDARAALLRTMRPVDTVGLKVNCLAGRLMSTHPELVEELIALMERAGVPRQQAVVFDRSDSDLRRGGFPVRSGGSDYRALGNDRAGYEEDLTLMPSGASRLARVATRMAQVLINLPVLKDHGIAGVSGALKNNFGLVHNPNKYHLNGCDPHVAEVNALPVVRAKQRLVICDALRVQTDGGPGYRAAAAESLGALILATDPVDLDVVAWELLETLRRKRKLPTLTADKRRPVHIWTAGRAGLGHADRSKIDLAELSVS
jgi:uncharacterized protein (DUF362 family)